VTLDEANVTARYYLGLAAEQDGQRDKAAKIWRDLIATAPPDAFWVNNVRAALARVEKKSPPLEPTAAPMAAAAAGAAPEQQAAMIRGMVDRLAARLKQDGSDVDGWVRLVRSYSVLGEPEKGRAAAADARQALAGDPGKLRELDAAFKQLDADNTSAPNFTPRPGAAPMAGADAPADNLHGTMQSMVDRLAQRLKGDGSDPEGWVTLVRSYETLGESDKAANAIDDARRALAGNADKLGEFNTALKRFNIAK
jgi:cytochrome c-type biogenesis protein CcmH